MLPMVESLWPILLKNSLAGSILICLVFAAKTVLGNRISAGRLFWLWLLVILRFLTPWTPTSPVSFFNLAQSAIVSVPNKMTGLYQNQEQQTVNPSFRPLPPEDTSMEITAPSQPASDVAAPAAAGIGLNVILFIIWAVGAGAVAVFITLGSFRFWLAIRKEKPLIQPEILEMLEQCKEKLGIHTLLCIVQSGRIQTPALMGFIRPRLVLPLGLAERISPIDLRHILLHELAHLKRHDIFFNWAMAAIQILHWFNPLVWLAGRQMNRDRELACDELVLSGFNQAQTRDYGNTLLQLMKTASSQPLGIGLSGIVENKSFAKRRIQMISSYTPRRMVLAPVLVAVLSVVLVALTSAEQQNSGQPAEPNGLQTAEQRPPVQKMDETSGAPMAVKTFPEALSNNVDASAEYITVTFNQQMTDNSWSWTGGGETYPQLLGKPQYLPDGRTCRLNVSLQPGRVYWVGINSPSHRNFKNKAGVSAVRYVILFATKDQNGNPTPIPDDMLKEAKRINLATEKFKQGAEQRPPVQKMDETSGAPMAVKTFPEALSNNVDASSKYITVTFNQQMTDNSWSWTGGGETYPQTLARPQYLPDGRTCRLTVSLQPGKVYWIGINSPSHRNFKSKARVAAVRYVILFATKDQNGNPTPIPEDMLKEAKRINSATERFKAQVASKRTSAKSPQEIALDDGTSAGKKSIAGSGHAVVFDCPGDNFRLMAIKIFGSRYGNPQAPKEDFHVWLCDENGKVIEDFAFPYASFARGGDKWVTLKTKPTALPARFMLCAGFNPEQTKGVYVHHDGQADGNSLTGLPDEKFEKFEQGDWMLRAVITQSSE